MSTIITKRQFPHYHKYTMDLAGRPLTLEVGKLAELANAAVMVGYGDTRVLCCVTAAPRPRDGIDFFPLSVDFEEKMYSVGRIPGSFNRREGRPGEKGILTSRVIDRPIRPLFPYDFRNDVSVMCTVMAVDHDCSPEIAALIGTSAALAISDIPWNGPVAALKVGLVDGKLVFNPDAEQRKVSDLDVTVVSTGKKVVMIEAGANEVPNDVMFEAIRSAHEENQKQIALINQMVAEIGKPKFDYPHADFNYELFNKITEDFMDEAKAAMDTDDKNVREQRWNAMIEKWHEKYLEEYPNMDQYLEEITYKFQKMIVKKWLLEGHRVDGRQKNEIRPLDAEVGVLPRVHGSGLFTRGQTQVLSVCTLDTLSANQKLDTIWEETEKRYMHHYNFPGYSVGEAKPARSPGRREIGHGALAERALLPVIPPVEEFPYAIRVVSEVVSSNGSTSQGSICGSTLALMDAGVPIKAPVAGISCGLIQDDDGSFTTFIDIQGVEDFHGEMDFKVAGTKKGITAIQMDLKNDGLTMEIIKNALDITYDARCQILDQVMLPCIAEPRAEVSKYAPKMITMHIDPDKIRDVIGKGGSVIQKIVAESGAKIDIDDDGTIHIASPDAESCEKAKKCIDDIVFVPEVGQLYYGRVVRLMTFGAFVELAPGKDGLVHISKLADKRIEKVEDACKIGDMMWVKVTEIDEKGRVNLSHKDAMKEIAAKEAAGEPIK
ncbi:MAG: polyribonucleotide nucleotidyltransferase [Oscillospiraceae bacterium]|jgi:polyribonucleotide nucleotidyltransferase|uniref:polyribonucleotide nucleotidyltransferase n=1 Tax=Vescimonas sp. TaxID=2892404 RepID=UPI001B6351FA|nr:polyribonucleotide nucleotidyltransferase [Vescimonas sp.]MBP3632100.1 polyribonucleotide nucleotidyltransferase [Oscillospiraceae bacterium]MCI6585967.1 polyribonucleotide nucleotidyltransferase [Oscillibacter sp.]MCI6677883.1 polyribonucleotide nucleotidyltransferase [Oscillibacter sp.]MDY5333481.1 polyribonucleotide nucleotidyltransferase [Vescimonas sp.]